MSKKMTIVEHSYLSAKIAESNLTLKDFADRFGVCRSTVYKWVQNIDTITLRDAKKLSTYLSCPVEKLLELDVDSAIFCGVDSKKGGVEYEQEI